MSPYSLSPTNPHTPLPVNLGGVPVLHSQSLLKVHPPVYVSPKSSSVSPKSSSVFSNADGSAGSVLPSSASSLQKRDDLKKTSERIEDLESKIEDSQKETNKKIEDLQKKMDDSHKTMITKMEELFAQMMKVTPPQNQQGNPPPQNQQQQAQQGNSLEGIPVLQDEHS
jgi:TolA-binding protein